MLPIVFSLLSPSISSVLLLILVFLPLCDCVCTQCYGRAEGCTGNPVTCPWVTGLASNAAVISAAAGGVLSIVRLLPGKFVKLFPRAVIEGISSLCVRAKLGGGTFDTTDKTGHEIFQAACSGALSKRDAILAIHALIVDTPDTDEGGRQAKKLESTIKALEVLQTNVVDSSHTEGTLLYILFKVSSAFSSSVQSSTSFDLCSDCGSSEAPLKGPNKSFSATLKRPCSSWHCVSVLNAFALCCHALGVATFLTIGPFLEDVFYEPVRSGVVPWPVAFECIILYLRMIEASPGEYTLGNVVHKAGGLDSIRAQAVPIAEANFPTSVFSPAATFFRPFGGNPTPKGGLSSPTSGSDVFRGTVRGDAAGAAKGCTSWNLGKPHLAKNVDDSGLCRFKHACDQFVTDKGPGGQCLGAHKRKDCDYDPSKKTSKPVSK